MLAYSCPETSRLVHTSIDTSQEVLKRLGALKVSVWCPHCQTGHQIRATDAVISDRRRPPNPGDWTHTPTPVRSSPR
ncbi:MAG: hypothetical protein IT536_18630 [Hyphomicrobiales bacterium]|nr:hypothetical protein [Hyphomicrobiales bacterium]